jgi:MazG family protein
MNVSIERLRAIMAALRDPQRGCPWDREQTWATIAPHTLEEAYELADAIERDDVAHVRDELGDLLFQVVFQARIAEERGLFDFDAVATAISDKLERRHPHVFGTATIGSAAEQTVAWEEHKAAERRAAGVAAGALDGIALGLPALTRAAKLGKRAAGVRFDWARTEDVLGKVEEECVELRDALAKGHAAAVEEELGDLLFSVAQFARHAGVDPETALRAANAKFERRFKRMEAWLAAQGRSPCDATPDELEALWARAKQELG